MKIRKFFFKISQLVTDPVHAFPKALYVAGSLYHNTYDYLNNSPHIISRPKAGRTWLRIMLNLVFANLTLDEAVRVSELERIKHRLPKLIFTHGNHNKPETLPEFFKSLAKKRVLILVRDPRDILVSSYFQESLRGNFYQGDIHSFVYDETYGIEAIVQYYNNLLIAVKDPIAIIRYEDLRENTEAELTKIVTALGFTADEKRIKEAVAKTEFKAMKKTAKTSRDRRLRPKDETNPESQKIRRGKIGGYTDYLTQGEQEFVTKVSSQLDPRYGYKIKYVR